MEKPCKAKTPELPRRAMGFLVNAELRLTPDDKGIGVFTCEFIPANTRVDDPHLIYFDEQETLKLLASLPNDEARRDWLDHAFGDYGKVAVHNTHLDDGGMVNHSDKPSLATNNDDDYSYSTRDIQIGEELTEDYRTYDHVPFFEDLCKKYGAIDWFLNNSKEST